MMTVLHSWLNAARRRHREKALVGRLLKLNDHLLQDIGLRRDQLQPDGIRELDVAPLRTSARRAPIRRPLRYPSLQGCG